MTELEACVLALLCRDGPMTAYQVRKEFERSRASTWRASTGSIYPLIKRMSARGLIAAKPERGDARGTRHLAATKAGQRKVEAWLTETPAWIGDATEDPIRTRVQFLILLPVSLRRRTIVGMAKVTEAAIAALDVYMADSNIDAIEKLAHEGARAMLEARATWLEKVLQHFNDA